MNEFQDVEFEDVSSSKEKDKQIRGSILYYNTSQVAQILDIPDSKVRYYSKIFDNILKIEVINKQRKYKQEDIDKLKYMLELQSEGMSLKQIEEYCSEVSFQEGNGIQIKESNPLSIQALTKSIMNHQEKQIKAMEERILSELKTFIDNQTMTTEKVMDQIKEEIATTVDDLVDEKLGGIEDNIGNINKKLDEIKEFACVDMNKIKEKENDKWWKKIFR